MIYYDGMSGKEIVEVTQECVNDCSHSGDCTADVEHWVDKVKWLCDMDTLILCLQETGAWDDLMTVTGTTLRERMLWIACCDLKENDDKE